MSYAFHCPRTCPKFGDLWCRFRPILDRLGSVKVCSHTAKVKTEYLDPETLRRAVGTLGGTWLGQGAHKLFAGQVATGNGFTLPNWRFPLVLGADGELSYDDYGGQWGNVADLERLRAEYTSATVMSAAANLGWMTERAEDGTVTIYHPSGGSLTVAPGGNLDMTGFQGQGCHEALMSLGIPLTDLHAKPEFGQVANRVQLPTV